MHRLLFSFGLIAVGLLPNFGQEEIQLDHPALPAVRETQGVEVLREKEPIVAGPKITFASLSVESVDAPDVSEEIVQKATEKAESASNSGWQPVAGATSVYSNTTSSAGSYAASSAGSYAASSAGSYGAQAPASSAGSYAGSQATYREASFSVRRPFAGIRARMSARRAARQSGRHSRQSARIESGGFVSRVRGACASCR